MSKNIMIQGTSSGAGKSIVCTALCKIFTEDGYKVAPFKSQNMALNSFVTDKGLEMGRAQVVQAEACNKKPQVEMNPVLLKPTGNNMSQIILMGKVYGNLDSYSFKSIKAELKPQILEAYSTLSTQNDVIVIEGAGSPAEINMNKDDIANMGMAKMVDSPVILVADIDRGGVFASIYGTIMLLEEEDRERIKGIIINKFRGKVDLLKDGIDKIEKLTDKPVLGVIPYIKINLEDEDSLTEKYTELQMSEYGVNIEIVRLPHISNATDFDVLRYMEGVNVRYVELHERFKNPDLIILPGTKNTINDFMKLKNSPLYRQLYDLNRKDSVPIIGICGGFQMLGRKICDPYHLEYELDEVEGLGLLENVTIFEYEKVTTQVISKITSNTLKGSIFSGCEGYEVKGYELHCGKTNSNFSNENTFTKIIDKLGEEVCINDGCINSEKNVMGTYMHGIFDNVEFTNVVISNLKKKKGIYFDEPNVFNINEFKKKEYQKLEDHFREFLDLEKIYNILNFQN